MYCIYVKCLFVSPDPISTEKLFFFFFIVTATSEIYTLSLHDALPISASARSSARGAKVYASRSAKPRQRWRRSEENTNELQSHSEIVCRLLLEKKKKSDRHMDFSKTKTNTDKKHNNPKP